MGHTSRLQPCRALLTRQSQAGMRFQKNEDLSGYIRGAHVDGPEICKGFIFQVPGQTPGVWGWNDTKALYCGRCNKLATEHIVLKEPKVHEPKKPKAKLAPPPMPVQAQSLAEQDLEALERTRAAESALQQLNDTGLNMLDESMDPLSIAAQMPKPKPKPVYVPPPAPPPGFPPATTA